MTDINDVDRRVAVLEQIAKDTATALSDIRSDLREMRSDYNWMLRAMIGGCILLIAEMAYGFGWIR